MSLKYGAHPSQKSTKQVEELASETRFSRPLFFRFLFFAVFRASLSIAWRFFEKKIQIIAVRKSWILFLNTPNVNAGKKRLLSLRLIQLHRYFLLPPPRIKHRAEQGRERRERNHIDTHTPHKRTEPPRNQNLKNSIKTSDLGSRRTTTEPPPLFTDIWLFFLRFRESNPENTNVRFL